MTRKEMRRLCVDQRDYRCRTIVNKIANSYNVLDLYDVITRQLWIRDTMTAEELKEALGLESKNNT